MKTPMPTLNLDSIVMSEEERDLASQIVRKNGVLYASKPKRASGEAKYLWRMVVFGISPKPQHQCIPVTASFDLDGTYFESLDRAKELDALAQRIEDSVPVQERHGTLRWGRALGYL